MKIYVAAFFWCLLLVPLVGCATIPDDLRSEQMLRSADCEQVRAGADGSRFSVATVEQISRLYRCEELAYVGSDDNYHFFYWYTKIRLYPDMPTGVAVARSEYKPVEDFQVGEQRIGEHPFPVSDLQ